MMKVKWLVGTLLLPLAMGFAAIPSQAVDPATMPGGLQPNIVYIVSDDQRWDSLFAMPFVQSELQAKGVSLSNFVAVAQPCCASRTSVLTGLYAHTHRVYSNEHGWNRFVKNGWENDQLAIWLQAAGYTTGFFGKYLNGYNDATHVPPGWDRWVASSGNHSGGGEGDGDYYSYLLSVDGVPTQYGKNKTDDYSTKVFGDYATDFIKASAGDAPFFMYFAPHAPHLPAIPYPGDGHAYDNYLYRGRAYDEADVSDKPKYVQDNPPLEGTPDQAKMDRLNRRELETLIELDRVVQSIVQTLSDTGELSNTMIVFTTDNGFMWGEHRLSGKDKPYVESLLLPFVARWDGHLPAGATFDAVAGNADLTKTWVDLAGATPGHALEGVNMMPLLTDGRSLYRQGILAEDANGTIPSWCELYNPTWEYTEYGNGEEEYYDLLRDPFQMDNRVGDIHYAIQVANARKLLDALCEPRPPGWHHGWLDVLAERRL